MTNDELDIFIVHIIVNFRDHIEGEITHIVHVITHRMSFNVYNIFLKR